LASIEKRWHREFLDKKRKKQDYHGKRVNFIRRGVLWYGNKLFRTRNGCFSERRPLVSVQWFHQVNASTHQGAGGVSCECEYTAEVARARCFVPCAVAGFCRK
jgi:hypothetical protein